jgi:hypothetical protein
MDEERTHTEEPVPADRDANKEKAGRSAEKVQPAQTGEEKGEKDKQPNQQR